MVFDLATMKSHSLNYKVLHTDQSNSLKESDFLWRRWSPMAVGKSKGKGSADNSGDLLSQFPASDIEMQLKYNDRNLFPRPIKSTAELFSFVQASEGVPPFILKEEWDGTRSTSVTADTLEGYALNAELKYAPKHYYAVKLNRGERVNSRGVELEMNMTMAANTPAMTQRAWLEVAKVITLKDGRMTCKEA